jgi:hypothetical protein
MALYPSAPRPNSGYAFRSNWPTVVGGPDWAQQSRALTRFGLAEADLSYRAKTWEQIRVLYEFFESVNGSAGRFTFVDFNGIGPIGGSDPGVAWSHLFVAKGNGVSVAWDLPTFTLKADTTTVSASLAAGTRTVTPASMTGIVVGSSLTAVDADGTSGEEVRVTAVTATTFTAVFANAHASSWLINAPLVFESGVAKTTVFGASSPSAGTYGVVVGAGTDGVDILHAGTAAVSSVIVTISATCRRAMRRAKFTTVKSPFLYEVPAVYQAGSFSVVEVRK